MLKTEFKTWLDDRMNVLLLYYFVERSLNPLHRRASYFVGLENRIEIRAKVKTRIYFPFAEVMTFHKNLSLKTCHKKQRENAISLDFLSTLANIGEHLY